MKNQKMINLKKAFKKLYCISLEKYRMIVENKAKEKQDQNLKEVEQNIE